MSNGSRGKKKKKHPAIRAGHTSKSYDDSYVPGFGSAKNVPSKPKPKKDRSIGARHKLIHQGTGATEKKITSQYQQRTGKSEGVYRTGDRRKAETSKMMERMYHPHSQQPRVEREFKTVKRKDPRTGKTRSVRQNSGTRKGRGR